MHDATQKYIQSMSLIRNTHQVKQSIDFAGVESGNVHPTDIDAVLEFDNKILILIEVKRKGNDLPIGQKLLLERLTDSWHTGKSISLLVEHSFKNDHKDIPLAECYVTKAYYKNKWTKKTKPLLQTLKDIADKWDIKKLKNLP